MASELLTALGVVLVLMLASWAAIVWHYRHTIRRAWREPVLRHPVLVIESDDWSPGPPEHAERLQCIAARLGRRRDSTGRPAVMTLGLILTAPDGRAAREHPDAVPTIALDDPSAEPILKAIRGGIARRVFAPQLHGLAHYWPETLQQALKAAPRGSGLRPRRRAECVMQGPNQTADVAHGSAVLTEESPRERASHSGEGAANSAGASACGSGTAAANSLLHWLTAEDYPQTEALPPHLQTRWADTTTLPSRPLARAAIKAAAQEEVATYARILGTPPKVAVPPTFVWTREVEETWINAGVEAIITPDRRYTARDANGQPAAPEGPIGNGQPAAGSALYLVRDIYFEPGRGHTADAALAAVRRRFTLGRPALLETHRANFTGDEATFQRSLAELDRLLDWAGAALPDVRFMSCQELAAAYRRRDPTLVDRHAAARLRVTLRRLSGHGRLRKLAWATGLALPAMAAAWLLRVPETTMATNEVEGRA
ncbi:hypothetical protein [Sediminicurvatus halobius]|uniref:Uncharacterized protein n=1 Tax=Sediminicurvatus halobius TaxID=2182432 RepID=A0A2U2N0V6_9GAMM|nr:hypothetical protein [Spiribacter halobius]PWG62673.1 hypothetical protein DEM34_11010 [Spiribacter halobius]UEX77342.1 glycosyl hydrolase [Spiribacter halobius]